MLTRWNVLAATPPGPAVAQYHFHFLFSASDGLHQDTQASCAPSAWTAGDGLIVSVAVPPQIAAHPGWTARVIVARDTHTWYRPRLGAMKLETAKELVGGYVVLPLGASPGTGLSAPDQADLDKATITLTLANAG